MRTKTLLEKASKLAVTSVYRHRHGAIIVKNGKIVATGINRAVNNPFQVEFPKLQAGLHAEVAALNACRKTDLTGATIYVARVARDGSQVMSKPCINCQKALIARGVKKVYYTIDSEMDL
jgi:deoxycytidylate deaminase